MPNSLRRYLKDPFLNRLYKKIRKTGPMKSISLDLNQECNIRCTGCYYFSEGMDVSETPNDESEFDEFIEREWQVLKKAYENKILEEDFTVIAYCPSCQTSLSHTEVALGYKKLTDPSLYYKIRGFL